MTFDNETIERVWRSGRAIAERHAGRWRKDQCGAWICREHYGNRHSEFGWKILRIAAPVDDADDELRPFNVRNDFDVGAEEPHCRVTSDRNGFAPEQQVLDPRNKSA